MAPYRDILEIDEEKCDGCGLCVPACAEGALVVENGKARVVADRLCDGLGACIGECPNGALTIIRRKADEFDEEAVEDHLSRPNHRQAPAEKPAAPHACPGSLARLLKPMPDPNRVQAPAAPSSLGTWPVKIRLVGEKAPFLNQAHLLVLADCTAVALADLHQNWLPGKVALTGCPKFDDKELYVEKFTEIFKNNEIRSVTCAVMEVPCCSSLPFIIKKAMKAAGKDIPVKEAVITREGGLMN